MARTERESDNRRREMADFMVLPRPAKSVQNRLQQINWNILGLPNRKELPQCHRESRWQVRRSRPCQIEKEQSRLFKAPDHESGESQGGQKLHLGEKGGDQSESMEGKRWTPQ